jgi:hypothetical protein
VLRGKTKSHSFTTEMPRIALRYDRKNKHMRKPEHTGQGMTIAAGL